VKNPAEETFCPPGSKSSTKHATNRQQASRPCSPPPSQEPVPKLLDYDSHVRLHQLMPNDNKSPGPALCPKCNTTPTIPHNGGQWCPRCGAFATPPDPRHTKRSQDPEHSPPNPFQALQAAEAATAKMPRCYRCQQPVDIVTGLYDDGDWLCGNCLAGYTNQARH
jgi:hypothetical protein